MVRVCRIPPYHGSCMPNTTSLSFSSDLGSRKLLGYKNFTKGYEYIRAEKCSSKSLYSSGGCHSHRLYSHSCDRGSKLWPALFGSLTVDHANIWPLTFDRSDILPAKKSRYLNCNQSPRACLLGNKRSAHVYNPTARVGANWSTNLVRSALGFERWPTPLWPLTALIRMVWPLTVDWVSGGHTALCRRYMDSLNVSGSY